MAAYATQLRVDVSGSLGYLSGVEGSSGSSANHIGTFVRTLGLISVEQHFGPNFGYALRLGGGRRRGAARGLVLTDRRVHVRVHADHLRGAQSALPSVTSRASARPQHGPHAKTPVEQTVEGLAATPHVTTHSVLPVHVVLQSPSHFTKQVDESAHVTVLSSPTWSLQEALVLQLTVDIAPSLKSQSALAVHVTWLASPPAPLQCEESLQVNVSSPLVLPSHLVESLQATEQSAVPHCALQSWPATQAHALSTHAHPAPVQVGAGASLPPHAAASANAKESRALVPSFIGLASMAN